MTSMAASGSHSEGFLKRGPTEDAHFAPASEYKRRKVYANRDFPPGCGRLSAAIHRSGERTTWEAGVTAVRDFPPFCGVNAPPLSKEELIEWRNSLKNKGTDLAKFSNEEMPLENIMCTYAKQGAYEDSSSDDVEESLGENGIESPCGTSLYGFDSKSKNTLDKDFETNLSDSFLEDDCESQEVVSTSGVEIVANKYYTRGGVAVVRDFHPLCGLKGAYEVSSGNNMEEGMDENNVEVEVDSNSNNARDKGFETELSDSSPSEDQFLEDDCESEEVLSTDRLIFPGLIASPRLQRKVTCCYSDPSNGSSKSKRKNSFTSPSRANPRRSFSL